MAKDPVCMMDVDPRKAAAQTRYEGQTIYFCAVGCKVKFDKEPQRYLPNLTGEPGGAVERM